MPAWAGRGQALPGHGQALPGRRQALPGGQLQALPGRRCQAGAAWPALGAATQALPGRRCLADARRCLAGARRCLAAAGRCLAAVGRYLAAARHVHGEKMSEVDEYRCFVGSLSWSTTDGSLKEAFQKFGHLTKAKIVLDKFSSRSRGFGFVTFDAEDPLQFPEL
ncbi:hypothetical protein ZIOFF_043609 [Zingiber officinale]|uniref:RRM domain-containing protein n=1 Tax=Zingiber officinale TaxID=94328 RepID=A0A8J5FXM1_ZINOF|nr:hypothetical protein ZIOFF_043609 [Zingiber officinale]